MPIKTSSQHERFGADAIHFKIENDKPIIILGEAKTYTSKYKFSQAFEDAITSILSTYSSHRNTVLRKMTSVNRLRKLLKSGLGILTITRLILPIILF